MRVLPPAWRTAAAATVAALVLAGLTSTSAQADDPSAAELRVRLVQSRQELNNLYAQSAMASERLNKARYEHAQAAAELAAQQDRMERVDATMEVQREQIAALAVKQVQSGSSATVLSSLLTSSNPRQLLERASATASVNQALTARLDALEARKVVHASAARAAQSALDAQQQAITDMQNAQRSIDESIARAEAAERTTATERQALLGQLAVVEGVSVAEVTSAQDVIDERLDQSGPTIPVGGAGAAPTPTPSQPATGVPAVPAPTPAPTTTQPTSPPTTVTPVVDPKPAEPTPVDPPPASGNKVETAIAYARQQLGEPYKWGGAGPSSWDCSGLTMRAWQAAGVNLSHYAGSQYLQTTKVPVSKIRRGDLLYWSNGGADSIYHVAMYLGGGQMIQAPRPGRSVEIVSLSYWISPDLASRPG